MPELIVQAVLVEGRTKSEVARDYRVRRRRVITQVQRYLAEGEAGLKGAVPATATPSVGSLT